MYIVESFCNDTTVRETTNDLITNQLVIDEWVNGMGNWLWCSRTTATHWQYNSVGTLVNILAF